MPWYNRAKAAIDAAAPFLVPTRLTNLALLVSAILIKKRTLCLSELARAYPATPQERRADAPKHDLCFTASKGSGASSTMSGSTRWRSGGGLRWARAIARSGNPRLPGLAIDWTMLDTVLPSGERMR